MDADHDDFDVPVERRQDLVSRLGTLEKTFAVGLSELAGTFRIELANFRTSITRDVQESQQGTALLAATVERITHDLNNLERRQAATERSIGSQDQVKRDLTELYRVSSRNSDMITENRKSLEAISTRTKLVVDVFKWLGPPGVLMLVYVLFTLSQVPK